MSDIGLIIRIPEELKNKIDNANEDNYRTYIWWFETTLYCAIKNGTPLPKGHGRLIDVNELKKIINENDTLTMTGFNVRLCDIDNTPTIIEAEESEET